MFCPDHQQERREVTPSAKSRRSFTGAFSWLRLFYSCDAKAGRNNRMEIVSDSPWKTRDRERHYILILGIIPKLPVLYKTLFVEIACNAEAGCLTVVILLPFQARRNKTRMQDTECNEPARTKQSVFWMLQPSFMRLTGACYLAAPLSACTYAIISLLLHNA